VDEEGNGAVQKFWFRLEISIKDGNIVTQSHIVMSHALLKRTSLVPIAVATDLIPDVDTFACPPLHFHLHQLLVTLAMKHFRGTNTPKKIN
jgi:hypothetical protein